MLDNNTHYYLWYPNPESQSRVDPHYGYMLAGYTMNGSLNSLKYIDDTKTNKLMKTDVYKNDYKFMLLNMTVYSYFTFLSFIEHIKTSDYVPKLELDWTILRDSCNELRQMVLEYWDEYSYIQKLEEIFKVKNYTDVIYTEPWITFDEYIENGMKEFNWSLDDLMKIKEVA